MFSTVKSGYLARRIINQLLMSDRGAHEIIGMSNNAWPKVRTRMNARTGATLHGMTHMNNINLTHEERHQHDSH